MKRIARKFIAGIMICTLLLISIYKAEPEQAFAETDIADTPRVYLNVTAKNLKLDNNKLGTFDFDVVDSKQLSGATYSWYIKADKGNPDAVTINRKTGVVAAKATGTAYVRCKVTLRDGTVLRPEAKVTVYNNITGVTISNPPETMTLTAGHIMDFNRKITDTEAGKGTSTKGITRWEITDDTAGVGNADNKGIVFPTMEGEFKIRAVCFQNIANYNLWRMNKLSYAGRITASSEWYTLKVLASDGKTVVSTKEQLDKALTSESFQSITLSTDKSETIVIEAGDYLEKSIIVNAPNADVENYGSFKDITIKAIKDTTWIEYADGNIVYLQDSQLSFVVDSEADIKQIVIDQPNSEVNLEINGRVGDILVLQPAIINLSGIGTGTPLTVGEKAAQSIISTSIPLNLTLNANAEVILNQGSENSSIDKTTSSIEIKIVNNLDRSIVITTNKTGSELIEAGKSGVSNQTTVPTAPPYQSSDNIIHATELSITPQSMVVSVSGSALYMLTANTTPEYITDTVTWKSMDEGVVNVDMDGVVTPVDLGETVIVATAGELSAVAHIMVVSGSAISASDSAIHNGLQSIGSTIAKDLASSAASYVGNELMGWSLKEAGIGFEDATQTAIDAMNEKLDKIAKQLLDMEERLNEAIAEINKQILDSEYNTRVGQMSALIGQIKSIRVELNSFSSNPIKDNPELLEYSRQEIISNIKNNLISNENLIHNQLMGVGSQESLIKVFSRAVKMDNIFLDSEDSAKVTTMYGYFEALQTSMLELMVEYYHAIGEGGNNLNNINRIINTYKTNIAAQKSLLLREIPNGMVIDTKQNLMIYTGNYRNLFYPYFSSKKTIPGPRRSNVYGKEAAFKLMCYDYGFKDWRLTTYDELQVWVKASKGNLLTYLINSGWDKPNMNREYEIGNYSIPFAYADITHIVDCYGYSVSNGAEKTYLTSNDGGESFSVYNKYFEDAHDYSFYWIVCRKMNNELRQYFY
ncbi:MAG TPA: Ig-like domain-containing protein [Mobilitalea sp.]|nr:Ig-like domain-containing protein [Mobilitalea sp.]